VSGGLGGIAGLEAAALGGGVEGLPSFMAMHFRLQKVFPAA